MKFYTLLAFIGFFSIHPSFAANDLPTEGVTSESVAAQDLMQITAEKFPGKTYYMGARLNDKKEISGFYFDDQFEVRHEVNVAAAKKGITLITMESRHPITRNLNKYDIVLMSINYHPETMTGQVEFSYLYNGGTGRYITQEMSLVYDQSKNKFQVIDSDQRPVNKAKAWTRYLFGVEIGVDRIDFSK